MLHKDFAGKVNLSEKEQRILYNICRPKRTYLEIGTGWGTSSCIAGLAGCHVISLDIQLGPMWENEGLTPDVVLANWQLHGVSGALIRGNSQGFDFSHLSPRDVGFIDGNHEAPYVREDYLALRDVCETIIFHDYGREDIPGVTEAVAQLALSGTVMETFFVVE